ncbi:MAG TPA: PRC-barrel domain-containing protein [Actinomycetota bacterium]|jgi:hypothetical protein|nr:PRC-barrel domain-containing protein [Actinomycetota bacterium]
MAAFDPATLDRWRALAIVDREGTTVGTISEFYLDRESGHPTWALVDTGLFGQTKTFVPLVHATELSDGLQVPYEKDHIKNAPKVDLHDELTPQEEVELFAHYGVDYEPSAAATAGATEAGTADPSAVEGDEGPGPVRTDPGIAATEPEPRSDGAGDAVLGEPGTTAPDGTRQADSDSLGPEAEHTEDRTDRGHARFQAPDHDPDLARTAPVEPGLPGSTAASPYGPTPTVDKAAHPSAASAEEPPSAPDEPGWPLGPPGSFEGHEPFDRPARSSDRWREAKLAAERERIAREAPQPEERSPLERARRRLERLVGGGQDHDDASAGDREAAERARRARLGMDDDDDYPRR